MWEKLKLMFLKGQKKIDYIEINGHKIGQRTIGGKNKVLYMLGSLFIEIITESGNKGKEILFYKDLNDMREKFGQDVRSTLA